MSDRPAAENDGGSLAAIRALHVSSDETRGVGRYTPHNEKRWIAYCEADGEDWPCSTVELMPADLQARVIPPGETQP